MASGFGEWVPDSYSSSCPGTVPTNSADYLYYLSDTFSASIEITKIVGIVEIRGIASTVPGARKDFVAAVFEEGYTVVAN